MARTVRLLSERFDPAHTLAAFSAAHPEAGAIASFLGTVRASAGGGEGVEALEISHYQPLTLPGMEQLADTALARFALAGLVLLHRIGGMLPGEPIVLAAAAARHRRAALGAVDFAMDHLKSDAWFWKREQRADGWHWIEPRAEDQADLARWTWKDREQRG